jgi:predicted kinase
VEAERGTASVLTDLPGAGRHEQGALVLLVGLPASGKSYFGRLVAARLGAEVIQTDGVRKELFREPRYTSRESQTVYAECHRRVGLAVTARRPVVFDATNLVERRRQPLYALADETDARLVIALTWAPTWLIRQRLAGRSAGVDPLDLSDATWKVYRWMRRPQPISRPHLLVNTAVDLKQAVELVVEMAGTTAGVRTELPGPLP